MTEAAPTDPRSSLSNDILQDLARLDPRGLIGDAYAMEGVGPEACRSIFLDWALGRSEAEGQGS
ncbi:MAG: hypothetical protein AAGI51_17840, partial [Pseudomonadota bacterium]